LHILFCFVSWKTKYLLMALIWFSQLCSSRLGADLWVFNFWEQFGYFVVIYVASLQCSVLVHSGGVHGGHYYAFIRPKLSDQWYIQFNIWIKLFFFRYLNTSFAGTRSHSCFNPIWKGDSSNLLIFKFRCNFFFMYPYAY
jgi:hypothetical protein